VARVPRPVAQHANGGEAEPAWQIAAQAFTVAQSAPPDPPKANGANPHNPATGGIVAAAAPNRAVIQLRRTTSVNTPPTDLEVGEPGVEMAHPGAPRLWIGVPTAVDVSGRRLVSDYGTLSDQISALQAAVRLQGTYNATTNQVATITPGSGLTVGAALPPAAAGNTGYLVIVTTAGTGTAPAPTVAMANADFIISNGSAWIHVPLNLGTIAAINVNVAAITGMTATHVQGALGELFAAAGTFLTGNQTITLSGDIAGSGATAITTTLPNVNTNVGTFQGIVVNAKGQVTGATDQGYLTANQTVTLSGAVTGSGTTAITTTLATVNSNIGTFQGLTVNAQGLVTAAADMSYLTSAAIADMATQTWVGTQGFLTGNQNITLSGDVSGSGTTAITAILANVNTNIGTFQGLTVNAKGLVTAAADMGYATQTWVGTQGFLTANQAITLSGDIGGSGTTAITATLPNINANVGAFQGITVNAKGQVTAATDQGYVTTTALGGMGFLTANQSITLSGAVTGTGTTAITTTLATVNSNVGTFQGLTVNAQGLVTAAINQNYLTANQAITLSQDVTGSGTTAITATVARIQNRAVAATAPTEGQVLRWNNTATEWQPQSLPGGIAEPSTAGSFLRTNLGTWVTGLPTTGGTLTGPGHLAVDGDLSVGANVYARIDGGSWT